jgi:pyruvate-formate lyase-activating enzyme
MCWAGDSDQIAKNIISATNNGAIDDVNFFKYSQAEYYSNYTNDIDMGSINELYEFIMKNETIRELKFAGGEPFVMPEVENLLIKLIKANRTNLRIFFLTNCTTVKTNILEILKHFDNPSMGCSIDGVDKWIEYQRFPVKWKSVKRNYHKLLKNEIETSIVPCWTHLNLFGVIEFLEWIKEDNITCPVLWMDIEQPEYLNWQLIPMKYRTELIKQLNRFEFPTNVDKDYHTLSDRIRTEVRDITEQERKVLYTNAQLWDFNNTIKYRDMFPWAKELLNE